MRKFIARFALAAGLACGALTAAPAAWAQENAETGEDEGIICLAFAHRWSGLPAERAQIAQVPVPPSFLENYRGDVCSSFQLLLTSLLDWHLRHGNEDTALAAVRFLEDDLSASLEPAFAADFGNALALAESDAHSLIERQRRAQPGASDDALLQAAGPALSGNASFRRVMAMAAKLENAEFIAGEYTRAADALTSRTLLTEARRLHGPAQQAVALIDERARQGSVAAWLAERLRPQYRTDRMSPAMRDVTLAVTEARIRRDAPAVQAAGEVTSRHFLSGERAYPIPDLLTFWQRAYQEDDSACATDERNSREGYAERCEENGFEQFAFGFWYQRGRLELLAQGLGVPLEPLAPQFSRSGTVSGTTDLFIRHAWYQGLRYGEAAPPPEAVRLLVQSAEAEAAQLPARCGDNDQSRYQAVEAVLSPLSRALALADAARQAALYREVAQSRVRVQAVVEACGVEDSEPVYARDLVLANAFLDAWPQLSGGE